MSDRTATAITEEVVAARPMPAPTVEPAPQATVRVRVWRKRGEHGNIVTPVTIDTTHPNQLPNRVADLYPYMPAALKRHFMARGNRYYAQNYDIRSCIEHFGNVVSMQQWADWIAAYSIAKLTGTYDDGTSMARSPIEGGYLAVGDMLYKISAIQQLSTSKAIGAARRNIIDKAKVTAESIIGAARISAKSLSEDAARMHAEARQAVAEAMRMTIPGPEMLQSGRPLRYCLGRGGESWQIGFWMGYKPKYITYERGITKGRWDALSAPEVRVLMWQPFDPVTGAYAITSCCTDGESPNLPHCNHGGSCMNPAMKPDQLKTAADMTQWIRAVANCINGGIELHSLFTIASEWKPPIMAFIPEHMRRVIVRTNSTEWHTGMEELCKAATARPEVEQEGDTWTL